MSFVRTLGRLKPATAVDEDQHRRGDPSAHRGKATITGRARQVTSPTTGFDRAVALALRYFLAIVAFLAFESYVAIYSQARAQAPIRSDGYSYYVYLPSWLIYGDPSLESVARHCCGGTFPAFTAITRWRGTGRWLNPHPIGTAILMAPFFAVAHVVTRWSKLPADGFSFYYQHAAGLAGLSYLLAGLAVLRAVLVRHFPPAPTLAALTALTFGTNLFHYGTYDATFSHIYSFFLICALIALTERWWDRSSWGVSAALGAVAALVFLTRHTNAVFWVMVPLYGITNAGSVSSDVLQGFRAALRERGAALWERRTSLAIVVAVLALAIFPQLAIYKAVTGSWVTGPYGDLDVGFRFDSPHLIGVLFSTEKGLFFWSPALLLAVAGLFTADGWARWWTVPAAIALTIETYLIASWSDWQFGGSYGHRAFTDSLGLLAIFMTAFLSRVAGRRRLVPVVAVCTSLAVMLSVFQMIQYWRGIVPIANTTWEQYRALFLPVQ